MAAFIAITTTTTTATKLWHNQSSQRGDKNRGETAVDDWLLIKETRLLAAWRRKEKLEKVRETKESIMERGAKGGWREREKEGPVMTSLPLFDSRWTTKKIDRLQTGHIQTIAMCFQEKTLTLLSSSSTCTLKCPSLGITNKTVKLNYLSTFSLSPSSIR